MDKGGQRVAGKGLERCGGAFVQNPFESLTKLHIPPLPRCAERGVIFRRLAATRPEFAFYEPNCTRNSGVKRDFTVKPNSTAAAILI
jgi:hypothetical protein